MGTSGAGVLLCCRGCRGSRVSSAFHLGVGERGRLYRCSDQRIHGYCVTHRQNGPTSKIGRLFGCGEKRKQRVHVSCCCGSGGLLPRKLPPTNAIMHGVHDFKCMCQCASFDGSRPGVGFGYEWWSHRESHVCKPYRRWTLAAWLKQGIVGGGSLEWHSVRSQDLTGDTSWFQPRGDDYCR